MPHEGIQAPVLIPLPLTQAALGESKGRFVAHNHQNCSSCVTDEVCYRRETRDGIVKWLSWDCWKSKCWGWLRISGDSYFQAGLALSLVIFSCNYLYRRENVEPMKPSVDQRSGVQDAVFLLAWVGTLCSSIWCKIPKKDLTGESLFPVNELSDLTIHCWFCLEGLGHPEHTHFTFTASPGTPRHHSHRWVCVTDQSQGDAHVDGMSGIWDCRTNRQLGDCS